MKEERMAILNMLEKGIISVDEAERLLTALHSGLGTEKDGITKAVGGMLNKAGAALSADADKVKENPAVKNAADKVADKADDLQPKVSSAAFRMSCSLPCAPQPSVWRKRQAKSRRIWQPTVKS